ncbi:MAG: ATP-dependent 6-phosphofructokinase [Candidatus Omnitrophota bacterium]
MKRIGILTGGGDCPGLNPVIRAVVRKACNEGIEVVGIKNGWEGMVKNLSTPLTINTISGILPKGGTILGTSRTNPYKDPKMVEQVKETFKKLKLDALIATGGEDTLGVAYKLYKNEKLNVVGIPKTIDNDLSGTDYTFGFDTAINIATECIDRLHTTAESHHRVMVVEVMGRHAGWIAIESGIAGGADVILIPEKSIDMDEVCAILKNRYKRKKYFSIVVVAEGALFKKGDTIVKNVQKDAFGHEILGGIGEQLANKIVERTGFETRVTVLGHILRGGSPSAFDRVLGTRFGIKAVELVINGDFGQMVALKGNKIVKISIEKAVKRLKTVDLEWYKVAKEFFG